MSTRPNFAPYVVIPNALGSPANGNSMAGNITSAPTVVSRLSMINYACVWTGSSPVGTISVQASDDFALNAEGNVEVAGTWNTLPLSYWNGTTTSTVQAIPISGSTGNGMIDVATAGFYAVRLVYTATSGTGALIVTINAKVA